ncbi:MAG: LamG domain-containing protein [Corynebacteriales bacterium]|nr:LamG domain-containing protein [Mycobacteriales bacterium]
MRWLCITLTLCASLLATGLPAGAAPPTGPNTELTPLTQEERALTAAQTTGEPVEIVEQRTEFTTVRAQPDGRITAQISAQPVRVKQDGQWQGLDANLHFSEDGRVRPGPTSVNMNFSGGGDGPMAVIHEDGKKVEFTFPETLPRPVLSGNTATYPLFTDVDLRIAVEPTGYTQTLIVATPEAAQNPKLAQIVYGLNTENLTVKTDAHDNLTAVDANNVTVFAGSAPRMWDSGSAAAQKSASEGASAPPSDPVVTPPPGAQVAVMDTAVSSGKLTVVPDQALIESATYPLYLDPGLTAGKIGWTYIDSKFPNQSYWNAAIADTGVGYEAQEGTLKRSFFRFDTSPILGKQIMRATFTARETWAWSCEQRPVQLWRSAGIDENTTWNNDPDSLDHLDTVWAAKGYPGCDAGEISFNATRAVQDASASNWNWSTFALTAENESDTKAWKRFEKTPNLWIEYNVAPSKPTNVGTVENTTCVSSETPPVLYTATPTLKATITDIDANNGGDDRPRARFEWFKNHAWPEIGTHTTDWADSGATHQITIPAGQFANGDVLTMRVVGDDMRALGEYSDWCDYRIDTSPPNAPQVTSTDWPENVDGKFVGETGAVTFAANGSTDVVAYRWSLNVTPPTTQVSTGTPGGSATVNVTPRRDGLNMLYVQAVDPGGNLSTITEYAFRAKPPEHPNSQWRFDEGEGTTVADTQNVDPLTVGGNAYWDFGQAENALVFPAGQGWARSADRVLNGNDMTVAVWVRPDAANTGTTQTVWAQMSDYAAGSARGDRFAVRITPTGTFAFSVGADNNSDVTITGSTSAPVGEWTHVAVTYSGDTGRMNLYINGQLASSGTAAGAAVPVAAELQFCVGQTFVITSGVGTWGERLIGGVDEMQMFTYEASPTYVQTLYQQQAMGMRATASPPTGPVTGEDTSALVKPELR